jgi:multicomponent Na+:H+ antiporter subunit G
MDAVLALLVGLLMIVGAGFTLIAALGVLRFPDVYTRMHAASKAGTLGSGLVIIGLAVYAAEFSVIMRALAAIVFFLLTAPLAGHLLARAAYLSGHRPSPTTDPDALRARLGEARRAESGAAEQ